MSNKKQWSDLTPEQQSMVIVGAAIEVVLTTTALIDLARRPATHIRGPKLAWALGMAIQPVGPIAYFVVGRTSR